MSAVSTTRFGEIHVDDADVVTFTEGLVGFADARRFVLIQHKEGSPFRWMQCLEVADLAFLVVDPAVFVPDYAPEMPSGVVRQLNLQEETPRLVYTTVTIPRGRPNDMTLNLAGPIVVNLATQTAIQVVLEDDRYPIRQRVFPAQDAGGEAA